MSARRQWAARRRVAVACCSATANVRARARAPAVFRLPRGHVEMAVAPRLFLKRARGRLGACPLRETADALALVAAVHSGPGQGGEAVRQGLEAVSQGQQGRPAKRDAQRFLGCRQHRGTRRLRPHRRSMHGLAPLPRRHGLGMDVVARRARIPALVTMLSRSTHCRCRAGAAVESLSHRASRD
jgi:hypothetical protein